MSVAFWDGDFQAAHGRAPRGKGIWTFELTGAWAQRRAIPVLPPEPVTFEGTYPEVRQAVTAHLDLAASIFGYTSLSADLNLRP